MFESDRATPTVFLGTPAIEVNAEFSPDGRWIAYMSNEAGGGSNRDVYVRPFPGPSGKWRVSTEGGNSPHWSATAHELLFLKGDKIMFAPYAASPAPSSRRSSAARSAARVRRLTMMMMLW